MAAMNERFVLRIDQNLDLPSIPVMVSRIIHALDDEMITALDLEKLLLHDPSLSARILRIANSAFYCFRYEVKTLAHAIPLLGENLVKSLAIGVQIFDTFMRGMKREAIHLHLLWMHSFAAGLVAQKIWARRFGKREGEFAFLCGLLHDIGKILFFQKDPQHYGPLFSEHKAPEGPDLSSLETEHYGVDHSVVGSMLAEKWGLPPELADAVRHHHAPHESGEGIAFAVALADALVREVELGYDGDLKVLEGLDLRRAAVQMDIAEWEELKQFAEEKRVGIEEFFRLAG